jgi:hypothetical protein
MKKTELFLMVMVGLSFVLAPLTVYSQEALIKDTAVFDKAYIPALFLTGQGKIQESKASMKFLKEGWAAFKKKYYASQPKDLQWRKDMDEVEELILSADETVASGQDLPSAHEDLETVRTILMDARQRNKIEYFPDTLTEFHGVMEEIFDTVDKKKPETLSDKDIGTLKDLLPDAQEVWDTAKKAKFDAALYGFKPEQAQKMKTLHKEEENALVALNGALEKGNKADIIKHALSLKPKFIAVYLLFGDFERLKK